MSVPIEISFDYNKLHLSVLKCPGRRLAEAVIALTEKEDRNLLIKAISCDIIALSSLAKDKTMSLI
ncbi:MAG: hypothetical protein AMK70_11745 [Nitrospira bacterium SG8_35_1]|nr:MAG: hypothetical protein AMK70_11745 [Nitrospira bacterium SG8_35_1]